MADTFHFDIPQNNDLFQAFVTSGNTLKVFEADWNDYVKIMGEEGATAEVHLGFGNDTIDAKGFHGDVTATGGVGSDVMIGGKGFAHYEGGDNNDTLISGYGGGWFDGGAARDVIDVSKGDATVHTSKLDHQPATGLAGTDVIKGFGCGDTDSVDGWHSLLKWDGDTGWLRDSLNRPIQYFEGHIGDTLVADQTAAQVAATGHQDWHLV